MFNHLMTGTNKTLGQLSSFIVKTIEESYQRSRGLDVGFLNLDLTLNGVRFIDLVFEVRKPIEGEADDIEDFITHLSLLLSDLRAWCYSSKLNIDGGVQNILFADEYEDGKAVPNPKVTKIKDDYYEIRLTLDLYMFFSNNDTFLPGKGKTYDLQLHLGWSLGYSLEFQHWKELCDSLYSVIYMDPVSMALNLINIVGYWDSIINNYETYTNIGLEKAMIFSRLPMVKVTYGTYKITPNDLYTSVMGLSPNEDVLAVPYHSNHQDYGDEYWAIVVKNILNSNTFNIDTSKQTIYSLGGAINETNDNYFTENLKVTDQTEDYGLVLFHTEIIDA